MISLFLLSLFTAPQLPPAAFPTIAYEYLERFEARAAAIKHFITNLIVKYRQKNPPHH